MLQYRLYYTYPYPIHTDIFHIFQKSILTIHFEKHLIFEKKNKHYSKLRFVENRFSNTMIYHCFQIHNNNTIPCFTEMSKAK